MIKYAQLFAIATLFVVANFASAAPVPADLTAHVSSLPATTSDQKLKKATLQWALEEATAQENAGFTARADVTVADVRALLPQRIGVAHPAPANLFPRLPAPQLGGLEATPVTGHGSVAELLAGNKVYAKGPAADIPVGPNNDYIAIKTAYEGLKLADNLCHPQSAYAADPRLIAPLFRRFENAYEYMVPGNAKRLADFGPSPPLAEMYLLMKTVYPDLILPSRQKQWDDAIAANSDAIMAVREKLFLAAAPGTSYVNADVKYMTALTYAGLLLNNPRYTAAAKGGLKLISSAVYPDGGFAYIGWQNECPTYHPIAIGELGRYYQVTGDVLSLQLLKKAGNYFPLSHEPSGASISEFSTAPSWKHNWSGGTPGTSPQLLASLTGKTWPETPADNYFVYDRNVEGPRVRFGTFSSVGTTRDYHNDNRGKSTYVGCMVVVPPGQTATGIRPWNPLSGALDTAGSEIQLQAGLRSVRTNLAALSQDEHNSTIVTRDFAALGTVHSLSMYEKPATEWEGQQSWLFLSHRLVGLVAVEAKHTQTAYGVTGTLQFVSAVQGGQGITALGSDSYKTGLLMTKIHSHNYAAIVADTGPSKFVRLMLQDNAAQSGKTAVSYPTGTRYYYLVEFYPNGTPGASDVTMLKLSGGLLGFDVSEGTKHFLVVFNPTSIAQTFSGVPDVHRADFHLYRSGLQYRPAWISPANTEEVIGTWQHLAPQTNGSLSFSVPANTEVVVTSITP